MILRRGGKRWTQQSLQACGQLLEVYQFAITRMVESFGKWDNSQWVRILKTAASVAGKPQKPISELETWVWWRYPIFSRHRWSAGEVCRAAKEKFGEVEQVDNQAALPIGLGETWTSLPGKRTRRNRPPFWDFVINEKVPKDVPSECPMLN